MQNQQQKRDIAVLVFYLVANAAVNFASFAGAWPVLMGKQTQNQLAKAEHSDLYVGAAAALVYSIALGVFQGRRILNHNLQLPATKQAPRTLASNSSELSYFTALSFFMYLQNLLIASAMKAYVETLQHPAEKATVLAPLSVDSKLGVAAYTLVFDCVLALTTSAYETAQLIKKSLTGDDRQPLLAFALRPLANPVGEFWVKWCCAFAHSLGHALQSLLLVPAASVLHLLHYSVSLFSLAASAFLAPLSYLVSFNFWQTAYFEGAEGVEHLREQKNPAYVSLDGESNAGSLNHVNHDEGAAVQSSSSCASVFFTASLRLQAPFHGACSAAVMVLFMRHYCENSDFSDAMTALAALAVFAGVSIGNYCSEVLGAMQNYNQKRAGLACA